MYDELIKGSIWAVNDSRFSFDKIQNMYAAPVFVNDRTLKPMSSGLNKLARV